MICHHSLICINYVYFIIIFLTAFIVGVGCLGHICACADLDAMLIARFIPFMDFQEPYTPHPMKAQFYSFLLFFSPLTNQLVMTQDGDDTCGLHVKFTSFCPYVAVPYHVTQEHSREWGAPNKVFFVTFPPFSFDALIRKMMSGHKGPRHSPCND